MMKKSMFVLLLIILLLPQVYPSSGASCDSECVNFENYYDGAININFNGGTKVLTLHFYGTNLDNGSFGINVTNAPIILKLTYKDKYDDSNNNKKMTTEYKVLTTNQGGDATYDLSSQIQNMTGVLTIRALYCYNYTDKTALDVCGRLFGLSGGELENKLQNAPGYPNTQDPQSYQSPKHVKIAFSDYYYTKPTNGLTAPAFCLPVAIVLALVMAGMQAVGKNPLAMFDISTPHMNNVYAKYNARGVTTMGASITSVVGAATSLASNSFHSKGVSGRGLSGLTSAVGAVTGANVSGVLNTGKTLKSIKKNLGGKTFSAAATAKMVLGSVPIVGGIINTSLGVSKGGENENASKGLKAYKIILSVFGALPITSVLVGLLKVTAGRALLGTEEENATLIYNLSGEFKQDEAKLEKEKLKRNVLSLSLSLKGKITQEEMKQLIELNGKIMVLTKTIGAENYKITQAAQNLSALTYGTPASAIWLAAANATGDVGAGADAVIELQDSGAINSNDTIDTEALAGTLGIAPKDLKGYESKYNDKKIAEKAVIACYKAEKTNPVVAPVIVKAFKNGTLLDKNGKIKPHVYKDAAEKEIPLLAGQDTAHNFVKKKIMGNDDDPISINNLRTKFSKGDEVSPEFEHEAKTILLKHAGDKKYTVGSFKEDLSEAISKDLRNAEEHLGKKGYTAKTMENVFGKKLVESFKKSGEEYRKKLYDDKNDKPSDDIKNMVNSAMNGPSPENNPSWNMIYTRPSSASATPKSWTKGGL